MSDAEVGMQPVIYLEQKSDWSEFVDFWARWYRRHDEDDKIPDSEFLKHLRWPSGRLRDEDIDILFEWKNGMPLSGNKKVVPLNVKGRLTMLNREREAPPAEIFLSASECSQSTVWRRFICHIVSPRQCPIWDKNVLRAFQLLTDRPQDPDVIEDEGTYDAYRSFFLEMVKSTRDKDGTPAFRRMDQAMFAFGNHYFPVGGIERNRP